MNYKCTNPSCTMGSVLYLTSFSEKQGCTHYCRVCGWGYWTHHIKPSKEEVDALAIQNPKASRNDIEKYLTKEVVKPAPAAQWGKTPETLMIEHLGGFQPYWLRIPLRDYWRKKYLELHSEEEPKKE